MMTALQQVSSPIVLVPAYGKVYADKAAMLAGWRAGHDFRVVGSSYASIRNIEQLRADSSSVVLTDPRNPRISVRV